MSKLLISIAIGIAAGILDAAPMLMRKMDRTACLSAFVHWVALGVIISYVQMPVAPWLKGLIVAELATLSVLALVFKSEPKSILPIVMTTAVLGMAVGVAAARFAG